MAIKQRVLDKLATIEKDFIEASEAKPQDALADALALLSETKNECRQGLPESRHADYDELCDGLMLALGQLATGKATEDKGEVLSLCGDLLKILNNKIQEEGGFKKEIVFLPYKSSMWDSLESVWRAACEDKEHCIPYVIPIPYADLTPEHTVAEWHCEKDIFPKDVPVVDWQTVDLEKMHPDVIFIHNPYDEYNRVTSVESRYYSSVLKKQTEKLVYIPYFVLADPELNGKSEEEIKKIEEGIEGFILTPAVLNAHQVIVQSEAMRRVYIDVLTRETNQKERAYWKKRILGTGSPKFDKVTATKREDLDIPEQWLKIIRKSDGTWKKIIFYNTGLSALLEHNEKILTKIRQVLQTFKKHIDEIALLWRPHPLMEATIESMRPELAEEYVGIVRRYKKEGWGIYDDSTDMDRAVILSDAYYGDASSVVQLYKETGKPIMIQEFVLETLRRAWAREEERRWKFSVFDVYDDSKNLWFTAIEYNALFCMSKDTGRIEYKGSFPDEDVFANRLYTTVTEHKGKLYFTPCAAHAIGVYDIKTNTFGKIEIGISRKENKASDTKYSKKFISAFIYDNTLVLLPCCYDKIVYCDLGTREITEDEETCRYFYEKYHEQATAADGGYYFCWFAFKTSDAEVAFHLHTNVNVMVFYNLATRQFREEIVGSSPMTYLASTFDGRHIWLYNLHGDTVIKWDVEQKSWTEINIADQIQDVQLYGLFYSFINMSILGDYLYVLPANANMAIKIDIHTNQVEKEEHFSEECVSGVPKIPFTHLCKTIGKTLYACGSRGMRLLSCDASGEMRQYPLELPKECRDRLRVRDLQDRLAVPGCVLGDAAIRLEDYLAACMETDCGKTDCQQNVSDIGKKCLDILLGRRKQKMKPIFSDCDIPYCAAEGEDVS